MECEHLKEHYEAFALGALEGATYTELQAHLTRRCSVCTRAVERWRWVVAHLAYLAPEAEPPARARHQLLNRMGAGRRPRMWVPVWAWAGAAVVLLLVSLFTAWRVGALRREIKELETRSSELAREAEAHRQVLAIMSAPETRALTLSSSTPGIATLRAYWSETLGLALVGQEMPTPAAERIYQLWVVPKQGTPIGVGIFRPDAAGNVLLVSLPDLRMAESAALAVTDEPAGGSVLPTTKPIWVTPLTS